MRLFTGPSKWSGAFVLLLLPSLPALAAPSPADEPREFFEKHVRPIVVDHCYKCHSAAGKVKGELRLDTREGTRKGGKTGPAIQPGNPDKSLLIEAVRYTNEDLQMPPKERLTDTQVADLVTWIKTGAFDPRDEAPAAVDEIAAARNRWPYSPVTSPTPPAVQNKSWPKNPIDRFILSKLEEKQLAPAPPADKRTLIRRATYDLTGLPPTIAEVDAFLADTSPDAYVRLIDRLLASPAYGQRYARYWLDLVRYTDSFDARGTGGPMDCAEAWRYRDYVVDAFNQDLPYDQFIRQQIAGDLMKGSEFRVQGSGAEKGTGAFSARSSLNPEPRTLNPLVATTVYAIGNWGGGDADKEKLLTDIVDDQIDLTGRAFLGLTLACARCHDHKFDPIATTDYYGLAGIFFSSHILPDVGPKTNGPNMLKIPLATPDQLRERDEAKQQLADCKRRIDELVDDHYKPLTRDTVLRLDAYLLAAAECVRDKSRPVATVADARRVHPAVLARWIEILGGADAHLLEATSADIHGIAGVYAFHHGGKGPDTPSATVNPNAAEASFITIKMPPRSVAVHPSPKTGVSVVFRSPFAGRARIAASVADADPNCGDGIEYTLTDRPSGELARGAIPNGGKAKLPPREAELREGDAVELTILPKGDYSCDTTVVELSVAELSGAGRKWDLSKDVIAAAIPQNPAPDAYGHGGVWRFVDAADSPNDRVPKDSAFARFVALAAQPVPDEATLRATATAVKESNGNADAKFRQAILDPRSRVWAPLRSDDSFLASSARHEVEKLRLMIPALQAEASKPFDMTHGLQEGGCPASPQAGIHDVKVHIRGRYDRLGPVVPRRFPRVLAGDDQPPITQGSGRTQLADWIASPTNPLTARVMANRLWQWHFGEGIVRTPSNFGKLGTPPTHPELLDYLATQFTQSGWSMKALHRQIMLSATYQQSTSNPQSAIGNPQSPDPDNLLYSRMNRRRLDAESLRDTMLATTNELDLGANGPATKDLSSPRRTLYLMTIRSDRTGYRMLFDAADPTAIIDHRTDSTVAPQALFLMNHPFVTARAKKLAARSAAVPDRIAWLYQTLFSRPPRPDEVQLAQSFIQSHFTNGWEQYCHALLCSNELAYVD